MPFSSQIWDFFNILFFFKILSVKSLGNSFFSSYTKVYYTWLQVSFYLWSIGSVLEHCKVPEYYHQGSLKTFIFALYTFNDYSSFWKKDLFGLKRLVLLKNY